MKLGMLATNNIRFCFVRFVSSTLQHTIRFTCYTRTLFYKKTEKKRKKKDQTPPIGLNDLNK